MASAPCAFSSIAWMGNAGRNSGGAVGLRSSLPLLLGFAFEVPYRVQTGKRKRTLFPNLQAANGKAERFFPTLNSANFTPQVRSNFSPGFELAFLALCKLLQFWHGLGVQCPNLLHASI